MSLRKKRARAEEVEGIETERIERERANKVEEKKSIPVPPVTTPAKKVDGDLTTTTKRKRVIRTSKTQKKD
tara:strand:+ start:776 stop:988 length:213 start_codon:yes stop_codon:yes gene_type:complete